MYDDNIFAGIIKIYYSGEGEYINDKYSFDLIERFDDVEFLEQHKENSFNDLTKSLMNDYYQVVIPYNYYDNYNQIDTPLASVIAKGLTKAQLFDDMNYDYPKNITQILDANSQDYFAKVINSNNSLTQHIFNKKVSSSKTNRLEQELINNIESLAANNACRVKPIDTVLMQQQLNEINHDLRMTYAAAYRSFRNLHCKNISNVSKNTPLVAHGFLYSNKSIISSAEKNLFSGFVSSSKHVVIKDLTPFSEYNKYYADKLDLNSNNEHFSLLSSEKRRKFTRFTCVYPSSGISPDTNDFMPVDPNLVTVLLKNNILKPSDYDLSDNLKNCSMSNNVNILNNSGYCNSETVSLVKSRKYN